MSKTSSLAVHKSIIEEHTKTLKEHEKTINELKTRLNLKDTNDLFKKYMIAIQDINRQDLLENSLNGVSKKSLTKLRKNRIGTLASHLLGDCHYLDDEHDLTEQADRRYFLFEKIKHIPKSVKNKFDEHYPNLLNDIELHLDQKYDDVSPATMDEINLWWE